MIPFEEYIQEKTNTGTLYKIKGASNDNRQIMYRNTGKDWFVSKDNGTTWKKATPDHASPMYNTQDIEAEVEAGSIEKVKA